MSKTKNIEVETSSTIRVSYLTKKCLEILKSYMDFKTMDDVVKYLLTSNNKVMELISKLYPDLVKELKEIEFRIKKTHATIIEG